ncbi:hypothetical protein G7Y89_g4816 [Cudoniella acicularis]|uniref:Peptidase S8/S53 domain-containing protein n=1 Tax=Cudoniella acicularis TaxID=354080 RepID=A0A8H4W4C5_9HELO|nr:hypothetical protein G7Y89_g4816 [Cudoniella acicularis]
MSNNPGVCFGRGAFVVDSSLSPVLGHDNEVPDSDLSSDEDGDDEVSVKRRFEQIINDLKNKNELDLTTFDHNAGYLGQKTVGDGDHNTLLHLLVEDAKDKVIAKYQPLVKLLLDRHPHLIIACYHSENCLHVAIRRNVAPKLALFLIERAGEETLCAKDDKGNTPLHLAVDYERCTDGQLEVVKALVSRCDKAMDERTNAPNLFSPYLYYKHTRRENEITGGPGGGNESGRFNSTVPKSTAAPKEGFQYPGMESSKLEYRSARGRDGGPESNGYTGSEPRYKYNLSEPPSRTINRTRTGTGLGGKPPAPAKDSKSKIKAKEEAKATEESMGAVRSYLRLHCMRTRNHDDAVDFLYGRNQENQIYFGLYEPPSLKISEERIEEGLVHLKFEDVLQYVALPSMQLEKKSSTSKLLRKLPNPDGKGRSDMVFLFNFLRNKRVKRVIRVIVDDTMEPAHSDEAIEKALGGLKVEIWDWRKIDLCTKTIVTAAPDAEVGGLKMLTKLEKVYLHFEQGLETSKRTRNNIRDFQRRLKLLRPEVEVEVVGENRPEKSELSGEMLTCMNEFADFIQNVESPLPLQEPVTIALIDDGVDINEQSLHSKIIGGRSFCQRDRFQNLSKPYYVTSGGHGTVMASLICRVCPNAQLFVVKLDNYVGESSKRRITAKSAAKAVRAAVDKNVHIISMSWTIERTAQNAADIQDLEAAIEAAARAGILMSCAANDQGITRDQSFPAACGGTKHLFKIGAAEASGAVWKFVGDPADVDFIFPGHNVVKDQPNDAPLEKCKTLTGSSVAPAIASGLAALVLYCVRLGALNTQVTSQQSGQSGNAVTMANFKAIKGHERMKEAFLAIGTSQASGNKYIEVWDVFGPVAKKAERVGREGRIEILNLRALQRRKPLYAYTSTLTVATNPTEPAKSPLTALDDSDMVAPRVLAVTTPDEGRLSAIPEFTLFPKLPTELCNVIWTFAMPGPRLVEVEIKTLNTKYYLNEDPRPGAAQSFKKKGTFCGFKVADQSPPALLHTCHQSRLVALRYFQLCLTYIPSVEDKFFEKSLYSPSQDWTTIATIDKQIPNEKFVSPGIWLQPDIDTVYFPGQCAEYSHNSWHYNQSELWGHIMTTKADLKVDRIRSVGFGLGDPSDLLDYIAPWSYSAPYRFPSLTSIQLFICWEGRDLPPYHDPISLRGRMLSQIPKLTASRSRGARKLRVRLGNMPHFSYNIWDCTQWDMSFLDLGEDWGNVNNRTFEYLIPLDSMAFWETEHSRW